MRTISYPFKDPEKALIRRGLDNDGIMVFPTETFYAIGCLASSSVAVEKIYSLKRREKDSPLLVLVDSWEMLEKYAENFTLTERNTLEQYWPGPLTAVLKHKGNLAGALNLPGETLGFRMTSSPVARELVSIVNAPLVGTSANISASESISRFEITKAVFGEKVDLYIDGGDTPGGLPSTLVDMTDSKNYRVLREGSVDFNPVTR
jgi:L-threonylcarbamoyladenylate synthase